MESSGLNEENRAVLWKNKPRIMEGVGGGTTTTKAAHISIKSIATSY